MLHGGHRRVERESGVRKCSGRAACIFTQDGPFYGPFSPTLRSAVRVNSSKARLVICALVPRVGGVTMARTLDRWRHHLVSTYHAPQAARFHSPPLWAAGSEREVEE